MDIASQEDDGIDSRQPGDRNHELNNSDGFDSSIAQGNRQVPSETPPSPNLKAQHFGKQKWKLSQEFYKDGYAELLRAEMVDGQNDGVPPLHLDQSQVGAVIWYPYEKAALYQALSRRGQRDLPYLAAEVGSKSQLEIRDYLLLLREKVVERHLFHQHTKTITYAEIPAAVEISAETEEALEKAADAQLAYEDHYELVAGVQKNDGLWRIDSEAAERLDVEQDKAEEALEEQHEARNEANFETSIFHISTFVELSERLFMNYGTSNSHENWSDIAMEGETPAVTPEVISELYDLAVNFSRKLIQTSLFLAQSRQRATTNSHYRHRAMVREQDVAAAGNVLGLKCDLWGFWVGVPRRNNLAVIDEKRSKGHGRKTKMSYEVVEQILSKRRARWRGRRRSSSAGSDASKTEDEAFDTADQMSDGDTASNPSPSEHAMSSDEDGSNVLEAHPLDAILDAPSSNEEQEEPSQHPSPTDSSPEELSDDFGSFNPHAVETRQKRRQAYLEYQQDDYLDQIDAEASREEETHLWERLGREQPINTGVEDGDDIDITVRSKALRKPTDDLKDPLESCQYGAAWELFGAVLPNDSFLETERKKKRARTLQREFSSKEASEKSHLPFRKRSPSTDARETWEIESTEEV